MDRRSQPNPLKLAIPKGRLYPEVTRLLEAAGMNLTQTARNYRPKLGLTGYDVKILKPQSIVSMLKAGSRDVGFAGADWVFELGDGLQPLLETGLNPVRIVAAAPSSILQEGQLPDGPLRVASEYPRITRNWTEKRGLNATFIRSYGATEVLPPEDADLIVDNTSTGSTLEANGLQIVDQVMQSSTALYASETALKDTAKRAEIDNLVLLLTSVLEARKRVMVEINVTKSNLESLISVLPSMREPTISTLSGDAGFAVKAAVPRNELPSILPLLKRRGGTDLVVSPIAQIIP